MPEQCSDEPAEREHRTDVAILALLVAPDNQRPWAVDEIEREIGKDTPDSLNRLYGVRLIHRLEGFVWATRTALRMEELSL